MTYDIIAITNNENPSACSKCGGGCCKSLPGEYWPHDFNHDIDKIREVLDNNLVAVDWWENYENKDGEYVDGWYIRPKTILSDRLFDPSWGGQCINLTQTGCSLSFEERPHGCKDLVPHETNPKECFSLFTKYDAAKMWEPCHWLFNEYYREEN